MTKDKIVDEYFNLDQKILFYILNKGGETATIKEISEELNIPRTTASEHIRSLKKDGFLKIEKDGKRKQIFPEPSVTEELYDGLSELHSSYVYALDKIKSKELKEIEKLKNSSGVDEG